MKPFWKLFAVWDTGFARKALVFRARFIIIAIFSIVVFVTIVSYSLTTRLQAIVGVLSLALVVWAAKLAIDPLDMMIKSQKRFIANASHELRTPLAVMKTSSEIATLHPEKMSREDLLDTVTSNMEEIDRMSERIQNLLRLANFDSEIDDTSFTRIDLASIVGKNADKYERLAKGKGIQLTTSIEQSSYINGNAVTLENLISNILNNALKYTKREGVVHISVDCTDASVVLRTTDTGVGIPPRELGHVFEPFYRGSNVTEDPTSRKGSGLGLTVVKEIATKHHAQIKIYSTPEHGTTVTVTFPRVE